MYLSSKSLSRDIFLPEFAAWVRWINDLSDVPAGACDIYRGSLVWKDCSILKTLKFSKMSKFHLVELQRVVAIN